MTWNSLLLIPSRDSLELPACAWQQENPTVMVFGNVSTVKSGLSSDPLRIRIEGYMDFWNCVYYIDTES